MDDMKLLHGDCLELMKDIPDESVDVILTDPPYQYLKNQKLDIPFDEKAFFGEVKRVLKRGGFIIMFGRGTAFYRWNCILADLGLNFKEEIVWNKRYNTSPLLPLHRVHETIALYCKGQGKIYKTRVPYMDIKKFDIDSVIADVQRIKSALGNPKEFEGIINFLKNGQKKYNDGKRVMKYGKFTVSSPINDCGRGVTTLSSITEGMNEKDIITEGRDHYKTIHPTQKPVRLLERLLNLVCSENATVLDPFMGSGSTGIACMNTGRKFIGMEIDEEYFAAARERIQQERAQVSIFE